MIICYFWSQFQIEKKIFAAVQISPIFDQEPTLSKMAMLVYLECQTLNSNLKDG